MDESPYWQVKDDIHFRFCPVYTPSKTLKVREGPCLGKAWLLSTLYRKKGYDARVVYSNIKLDRYLRRRADCGEMAAMLGHCYAEIRMDGKWIRADTTFPSDYEVGIGIPITQFGRGIKGFTYYNKVVIPDNLLNIISSGSELIMPFASGLFSMFNDKIRKYERKGRKINYINRMSSTQGLDFLE